MLTFGWGDERSFGVLSMIACSKLVRWESAVLTFGWGDESSFGVLSMISLQQVGEVGVCCAHIWLGR